MGFFWNKQHLQNSDISHISGKNISSQFPGNSCLLLSIIIPLLFIMELYSNPRWRISAESGFYQRNQLENKKSVHFVSRLNGYLKFQNRSGSNLWWLSLRLKPEFYQDVSSYMAIKMITKGQYLYHKSRIGIGMGLDIRRYLYLNTPEDISLDLFELSGIFSCQLAKQYQLVCYPAYYYQDISNYPKQNLDALKTKIYLSRAYHNQLNMGAGIYLEHFSVMNRAFTITQLKPETNKGYRYGPEVYLELNRILYFSARYSFLWHQSEITRDPSFEQYIRILFGKTILSNLTILCLVDYYWNDLTLKDEEEIPALYVPFDTENRIDLKIERPFKEHLVYYIRGGYFKEDFTIRNFTAQGWQFLLGFEYTH